MHWLTSPACDQTCFLCLSHEMQSCKGEPLRDGRLCHARDGCCAGVWPVSRFRCDVGKSKPANWSPAIIKGHLPAWPQNILFYVTTCSQWAGGVETRPCAYKKVCCYFGPSSLFPRQRLVNSEGANHRSQRARSQCVSLAVGPVARWLGVVVGSPIRAAQIAWSKMESRAQRAAGGGRGGRALDFRLDWEKLSLAYF